MQRIYVEGDQPDTLYVLVSGSVDLIHAPEAAVAAKPKGAKSVASATAEHLIVRWQNLPPPYV